LLNLQNIQSSAVRIFYEELLALLNVRSSTKHLAPLTLGFFETDMRFVVLLKELWSSAKRVLLSVVYSFFIFNF
jgi:hypothetical protein